VKPTLGADSGAAPGRVGALFVPERLESCQHADHSYLEKEDSCWALAEYRPGSYRLGYVNQLIANLKCRPSVAAAHRARGFYKQRAIELVAATLRRYFDRTWVEAATWVPIPISRALGNPDYDDRLFKVLSSAFAGYDLDLRMLLRHTDSMRSDHETARRLSVRRLLELLEVDSVELRLRPVRTRIVLFDDLLTSGKHFKCCQQRLRQFVPAVPICGCFIARRVPPTRWQSVPHACGKTQF
jgi:predicted amidophosphoribosyltransferase